MDVVIAILLQRISSYLQDFRAKLQSLRLLPSCHSWTLNLECILKSFRCHVDAFTLILNLASVADGVQETGSLLW